jgi:hypothetical protein
MASRHVVKRTSICLHPPVIRALDGLTKNETVTGRIADVCDRYLEIVRRARIDEKFSDSDLEYLSKIDPNILAPAPSIAALADYVKSMADADELSEKINALAYTEKVALVELVQAYKRRQMAP